jgi:hypothetical protein
MIFMQKNLDLDCKSDEIVENSRALTQIALGGTFVAERLPEIESL